MNQGVEILLARMDSNPDEFVGTSWPQSNKWGWVVEDLRRRMAPTKEDKEFGLPLRFLSDEEVRMLWEKLESLRADQFTKAVMRTLLEEEDEHVVENPFADAVVRGMGQLATYAHQQDKPTKIAVSQSMLKTAQKLMRERKK